MKKFLNIKPKKSEKEFGIDEILQQLREWQEKNEKRSFVLIASEVTEEEKNIIKGFFGKSENICEDLADVIEEDENFRELIYRASLLIKSRTKQWKKK